ncbi:MAG: hypothetical protein SGPRY_010968, partial [Prymnesium sp.]
PSEPEREIARTSAASLFKPARASRRVPEAKRDSVERTAGGYYSSTLPREATPAASGAAIPTRSQLFRHKFIVSSDFLIRVPLEGHSLLHKFVACAQLSGVLQLTLEAHRPRRTMRWSSDARRMLSIPNAGGSSIWSEVLSFELMSRAFGAKLDRTEMELLYAPGASSMWQPEHLVLSAG